MVVVPPFTDLRTVQTLIEGDGWSSATAPRTSLRSTTAPTPVRSRRCWPAGARSSWSATPSVGSTTGRTTTLVAKAKKALADGSCPSSASAKRWRARGGPGRVHHRAGDAGAGRHLQPDGSSSPTSRSGRSAPVGGHLRGRQEVCGAYPRGSALVDAESPTRVPILYGGRSRPSAGADHGQHRRRRCLVGGASLIVDEFAAIARFYDLPNALDPAYGYRELWIRLRS